MSRVRISTTVDGDRLERARSLLDLPDSDLIDRALAVLVEGVEADREAEILKRLPYDHDPDLAWRTPPGPGLPYEGEVPEHVQAMARNRVDE